MDIIIGQFFYPIGWEDMGLKKLDEVTVFQPATSFTSLEYMLISCKIQVMINPLNKLTLMYLMSLILSFLSPVLSGHSQSNSKP